MPLILLHVLDDPAPEAHSTGYKDLTGRSEKQGALDVYDENRSFMTCARS